nr:YbaY family lipoprotein [Gemmatimonadales bacterium]
MKSHPPARRVGLTALLAAGLAAGCAGASQPPAEGERVTGTVAYRERMALPGDAVVQVQLSDVSLQDVAAPVIAET